MAKRSEKSAQRPDAVTARYIESSALVAALLEHDLAALKSIRAVGRTVTSALTIAEAGRAMRSRRRYSPGSPGRSRSSLSGQLDRRASGNSRAAAWRATALLVIVTRASHVRENAHALGYVVE